jgi:hypothetical protein
VQVAVSDVILNTECYHTETHDFNQLTSEEKGKVSSIWKDNEYHMLFASDGAFVFGELSDRKKELEDILSTPPNQPL